MPSVTAATRQSAPVLSGWVAGSIGRITISAPAANSASGAMYPALPNRKRMPSAIASPTSPPAQSR
jgi:hypothetical protein